MARIREAVSALSRSGALNANDTAAFETLAALATSAMVVRRPVWRTADAVPSRNDRAYPCSPASRGLYHPGKSV